MTETKFEVHKVRARRDLLNFLEHYCGPGIYEQIGKNPRAWIDELSMVNQRLTGIPLVGGTGINQPPLGESDFRELGENTFLYRGENRRLCGLWTRRDGGSALEELTESRFEWTHFPLGSTATLAISDDFPGISPDSLLPESFTQGQPLMKGSHPCKRPIYKFSVHSERGPVNVYAKGSDISVSLFFESSKPWYRLTPISQVARTKSRTEMEMFERFAALGIKTPKIVAIYESPAEEFLFVEEVPGKSPQEFLPDHKEELIRQDASMLATMCLTGSRKIGFSDFDDKIFDGTHLYLIDVDECRDLYPPHFDFRQALINPTERGQLRKFRRTQRQIFISTLRDALHGYSRSLTSTDEDKEVYAAAFFQKLDWNPSAKQMRKIISISKDYMPHDEFMALMSDSD